MLDLCMYLGKQANHVVILGFTHYGIALNEFNQRKFSKAQWHIEQCVLVAEKYATRELMVDVYKLAFEIHRANRFQDKAFYYLERYAALKDQLHSEDIEKKAAIINASYEIQKKESELAISNQRNAIQRLEIKQQRIARNISIGLIFIIIIISLLVYSRIQGKRKFEQKELNRKKEEMEQARKVQLSLLPKVPLNDDAFRVEGKMITATEVGGDYYDYIKLDKDRVLIAFGDATGHGTAAGMLVMITKVALFNNLTLLKESNNVVPLAKVINESILTSISVKGIGISLQLCLIDRSIQKLSLTSCGMPHPILLDTDNNTHILVEIKQPPLGFFRGTKIELTEIEFKHNTQLLLISDGILERFSATREEYGMERLAKVLSQITSKVAANHIIDAIFSDVDHFAKGIINEDDMTILVADML